MAMRATAPRLSSYPTNLKGSQSTIHHHVTHYKMRAKNARNGKISSGPYGNAFMRYLGLNRSKWQLLTLQKQFDRADELWIERAEADAMARKHCSPEWQWQPQEEKDPYEPTPLFLRRFVWEAKRRRKFYDRRMPWLEEWLGEKIEDRDDRTFRAFPDQPRPQEHVLKEHYADVGDALKRERTPAEIEAICRPADTYYTAPPRTQSQGA
eukprot:TRINITY_DN51397_c0_g1_i1.p1 TRINITY_DN51397_c0_g1~~TRINITY_DN51397_c0_g1_i1.p1  ORF type:complete len:234 (+),score=93.57 TRINITY_DN51397_c0_g1_i1:76-702(+)